MLKIKYNSPVVLTFGLVSLIVLLLNYVLEGFTGHYFTNLPGFEPGRVVWYFRLFSHAFGHANWEHLIGNFSFILLIGPILEEKYGGRKLLLMMLLTAMVTGLLNCLFFSTGLLGASGIVFMMILLGSLVNMQKGTIPLTFILIVAMYIGREVYAGLTKADQVSQFAHLVGGLCGGIFGFMMNKGKA